MFDKIQFNNQKLISTIIFTTSIVVLCFTSRQANATNYSISAGQITPNPIEVGDDIAINGSVFNTTDFINSGLISIYNGATLANKTGASLTNSGTSLWTDQNGNQQIARSLILNLATLTNSGTGTRLLNQDGAEIRNEHEAIWTNEKGATISNSDLTTTILNVGSLVNSGSGSTLINQSGASFMNQTAATQTNEDGAIFNNIGIRSWLDPYGKSQYSQTLLNNLGVLKTTDAGTTLNNQGGAHLFNQASARLINSNGAGLVNSGVFNWIDENGNSQISQSSIINSGIITNSGAGATFNNQSGANLWNQTDATLANQNGAVLNNSGSFTWNDHDGNAQVAQSLLKNQGTLLNSDTGTVLNNLHGATLWNQSGATLINQQQAVLRNESNASILNEGVITNNAIIINQGNLDIPDKGIVNGTGNYVQTAGKTFVDGQWAQSLTDIQGGELSGSGKLSSALVVNGGSIAPGNFTTLTLEGNLTFNSGFLNIKVAGFEYSDFFEVIGTTTFNRGTVTIDFIDGYVPADGESLAWMHASGGIDGFANVDYIVNGLPNGVSLNFNNDDHRLSWIATGTPAAPVPLPLSVWLFLGGLFCIFKGFRLSKNSSDRNLGWLILS